MKKLFVLIAPLLVAAACTAPPTNREVVSNTNTSPETATAPAMTEADAIAKEKAIWDTIKNKDYDAFAANLAEDQLEVTGSEGVLQKTGSVSMVRDFEPTELNFSDWKFMSIDKDAWIVMYTINVKGKYKGKDFPPATAHCSSAWAYRNGKWQAIYHQETEVAKTPPPPPPATATASASPATTPATITTSSDVVANEKAIWDLLKNKQFDTFADQLAPEAYEIEPNGFSDKAAMVAGVKTFDFSKASTSDFKTLSIDADAALVTYVATFPGMKPETERHTTIWANRNGRWLVVFHQGTPVTAPMNAASPATSAASPALGASPAASRAIASPSPH
ncbi:MAG TPA: nuclear transport factor 2 family protein [Pyrinomonadaceae bacterium]|nr:nuclear transport factor 2 family protein [Pyrinomonadaceae bacterium]